MMENALAPSTRRSYQRSVDQFQSFCQSMGLDMSKGDSVELWIAHLSEGGIAHSAIRSRLSALKSFSTRINLQHTLSSPRITLLLKGVTKSKPRPTTRSVATLSHMKRLIKTAKAVLSKKDCYRFTAMMTLAFFGFLRPSEYCITNTDHNLKWKDVCFGRKGNSVRVTLRSFKHSQGPVNVYIGMTKDCCPVLHLRQYKEMFQRSHSRHLFDITAEEFRNTLKELTVIAVLKLYRLAPARRACKKFFYLT